MGHSIEINLKPGWLPRFPIIKKTLLGLTERGANPADSPSELISLSTEECESADDWELLFVLNLLQDLSSHGWSFKLKGKTSICGARESQEGSTKEVIKSRHEVERNQQLLEPSVARFISVMETPKKTDTGFHSIFSLMRDGEELSREIRKTITNSEVDIEALGQVVRPYIQFVDQSKCSFTGLNLADIWRYFRHTWTTTYRSVPGRNINMLIRDAAAPNHAVIGIASLGSSIVQQSVRDEWIGWTSEQVLNKIEEAGTKSTATWLCNQLQEQISSIRTDDLIAEGLLSTLDIRFPREVVIKSLMEFADNERRKHVQSSLNRPSKSDWLMESGTRLFRSKRASTLAGLLAARNSLQEVGFENLRGRKLRDSVKRAQVRRAISTIVRGIKAEHVGINMMDIMVCGSVAPYSHLLGGKLVCMLMMSPEIPAFYNNKYTGQESVIASSLKGESVTRRPQLSLLCTTSLYSAGSSQYNRVRLPVGEVVNGRDGKMTFERLGMSVGFGSYQFSSATMEVMNQFLKAKNLDNQVRNLFGEGVNPLLRKIRTALEKAGIPSEEVLQHQSRRIVYGIPLAKNFRALLMGKDESAKYFLPLGNAERHTKRIAAYWIRRWLSMRVKNEEVMSRVEAESLSHPIEHNARVPLYQLQETLNLELELDC